MCHEDSRDPGTLDLHKCAPLHQGTVAWTPQDSNLLLLPQTHLERPAGIAPATSAWQADALLLRHGRCVCQRRLTHPNPKESNLRFRRYRPACFLYTTVWSDERDLNPRPPLPHQTIKMPLEGTPLLYQTELPSHSRWRWPTHQTTWRESNPHAPLGTRFTPRRPKAPRL